MLMLMLPKRRKLLLGSLLVMALFIARGYGWYRYQYPYGAPHRCNIGIYIFLMEYTHDHDGNFPQGEDSATALSKLVTEYQVPESAWGQLVGKAFTDEQALECVRKHGRLTEEFCSWHLVQSLRSDSGPGLALFWDKTGLSHNGHRTDPPNYEVSFLDGSRRSIPASKWPDFLKRQEELREDALR
jgi:hypothetical protein